MLSCLEDLFLACSAPVPGLVWKRGRRVVNMVGSGAIALCDQWVRELTRCSFHDCLQMETKLEGGGRRRRRDLRVDASVSGGSGLHATEAIGGASAGLSASAIKKFSVRTDGFSPELQTIFMGESPISLPILPRRTPRRSCRDGF